MVEVGFEPTPPKRLELESSALDHSAIQPGENRGRDRFCSTQSAQRGSLLTAFDWPKERILSLRVELHPSKV